MNGNIFAFFAMLRQHKYVDSFDRHDGSVELVGAFEHDNWPAIAIVNKDCVVIEPDGITLADVFATINFPVAED